MAFAFCSIAFIVGSGCFVASNGSKRFSRILYFSVACFLFWMGTRLVLMSLIFVSQEQFLHRRPGGQRMRSRIHYRWKAGFVLRS